MAINRPARFEGPKKPTPKRPTNVSLNAELVEEARKLGINVSEACQTGLAAEVKKAREAAWKEANRPAIEVWNYYIRNNGLPYDPSRRFFLRQTNSFPAYLAWVLFYFSQTL